jgi:hypothetical protein
MKPNKRSERPTHYVGPGPVQKLQFLATAAGHSSQTRADLAILITIADMVNASTGVAWPSYATLARRSGCTDRHAKLTIQRLINKKLIVLIDQGNRVRSNRYALNLENLTTQSDENRIVEESLGSAVGDTTVVFPEHQGSDTETSKVVLGASPESIHQPEHKAREKMNGSSKCEALPSGAESPSGRPQPGKDLYPEFWDAYPLRAGVADAEQLLRELISEGHDYLMILEGARRYSNYVRGTGGYKRSAAPDWLTKEKWRDSWDLLPKKIEKLVKNSAKKELNPKSITKIRPKRRDNPAYKKWGEKYKPLSRQVFEQETLITQHIGTKKTPNCITCHTSNYGVGGSFCEILKQKRSEYFELKNALERLKKEAPPQTILVTD